MIKCLKEDMSLQRGIFWVKDTDDIWGTGMYFTIPCDSKGNNLIDPEAEYSSKDGISHNHENTWSKLSSKYTDNKPFNYYPRGRVEIRNGVAEIYCSPYLFDPELKDWCIDKFNLTSVNGIKKVRMIVDNSEHYKCHLDERYYR